MSFGLEQRVGETPGSLDDADNRRYLVEGEVALGHALLPSLTSLAASFTVGLVLVILLLRRRLVFLLAFAARVDLRVLIHGLQTFFFHFLSRCCSWFLFYLFIYFLLSVLVWVIVCCIYTYSFKDMRLNCDEDRCFPVLIKVSLALLLFRIIELLVAKICDFIDYCYQYESDCVTCFYFI